MVEFKSSDTSPVVSSWYSSRYSSTGIAKLLVADCETLAKVGLCCHFDSVIRPEAERIGAGVAV